LVRAISPLLLGAVARAVPYPFISSFFEKESLFCSIALFFVIFFVKVQVENPNIMSNLYFLEYG